MKITVKKYDDGEPYYTPVEIEKVQVDELLNFVLREGNLTEENEGEIAYRACELLATVYGWY